MKATGVIRRIDELGRIVIPKEIRKNLRIREGDIIEIFVAENNKIILSKFSPLKDLEMIAKNYLGAINKVLQKNIIVCDTENIIAATAKYQAYNNKKISKELEEIMLGKEKKIFGKSANFQIADELSFSNDLLIKPIVVYGDVFGVIVLVANDAISKDDLEIIEILQNFISNYLQS